MSTREILERINELTAERFLEYIENVDVSEISAPMMSQIRQYLAQNDIKIDAGTGGVIDTLIDTLDEEFNTSKYPTIPFPKQAIG